MSEKADSVKEAINQVEVANDQRPSLDKDESGETQVINERKLMWKIDLTLIPWLSLLYLLCFLDRVGIGNARVSNSFLLCVTCGSDESLALWNRGRPRYDGLAIPPVPYYVLCAILFARGSSPFEASRVLIITKACNSRRRQMYA